MIEIRRVGSVVQAHISTELPHRDGKSTSVFLFACNCGEGNTEYAELLRGYFSMRLEKALQRVRRKAYDLGWKHAKGKRRRYTEFEGDIPAPGEADDVGY